MKPDDFSQFDDPRVREVMAAAANLVEIMVAGVETDRYDPEFLALKTALFAAQHTRPKEDDVSEPLKEVAIAHVRILSDGQVRASGNTEAVARVLLTGHGELRTRLEKVRDALHRSDCNGVSPAPQRVALRMLDDILNSDDKKAIRLTGYDDGPLTVTIPKGAKLTCNNCGAALVRVG